MSRLTETPPLISFTILLNRLALGVFFLLAGVGKFQMGLQVFYEKKFLPMQPSWIPDWIGRPYGFALPFAEVLVGALLILGLFGRSAAMVVSLMLLSFSIALLNAGYFFNGPGPFHTNVLLFFLALWIAAAGSGAISLDALWFGRRRRR